MIKLLLWFDNSFRNVIIFNPKTGRYSTMKEHSNFRAIRNALLVLCECEKLTREVEKEKNHFHWRSKMLLVAKKIKDFVENER